MEQPPDEEPYLFTQDSYDDPARRRPRSAARVAAVFTVGLALITAAAAAGAGLAVLVSDMAAAPTPAGVAGEGPGASSEPAGSIDVGSPSPEAPSPSAEASPSPSVEPSLSEAPSGGAEPSPLIYVVEEGDNLTQIAARFGVTVRRIVRVNDLANPNAIEVGQELIIPIQD
jgi:LysM repeat protein